MFEKILIANRGEIALRIQRACLDMGIATVAIYSTADKNAMHVLLADESVCIGPPSVRDSYLNIPAIVAACEVTGADAVHPGYGFLAENAHFAEILQEHGIAFIGPSPEHIRLMGDKIAAKRQARALGLPVVPGSQGTVRVETDIDANFSYPLLIKAAAGGGGRGMQVVHEPRELARALAKARSESQIAFGDDRLYVEKYLPNPRHVEIQIIADAHGHALHLGERDCSLQRRHQKILEETPCVALKPSKREQIGKICAAAMKKMGYLGVGTIEFLYEDREFYFIEMNTRLQVEHPVTEMTTGIDLVREQIRVAANVPLTLKQSDVRFEGHAIECRINAESPTTFTPSPGRINHLHVPGGPGVRMDSAVYSGYDIPPYYDSLIGKLITYGKDRQECLMRLRRALSECFFEGIETTIPLFLDLLEEEEFTQGKYHIHWLEKYLSQKN